LVLFATSSAFAADIRYVVARDEGHDESDNGLSKEFYIYGGYNMHFANTVTPVNIAANKNGFEAALGFYLSDISRLEFTYVGMGAEYELNNIHVNSNGNFVFSNLIFDARISPKYQMFKNNPFTPFVGLGIGGGTISGDVKKDFSMAYDFIGGFSIEITQTFNLQFAYKYIKNFQDDINIGGTTIQHFVPSSHNVSVGVRVNF
jgi:opacity protein-like surface antigen